MEEGHIGTAPMRESITIASPLRSIELINKVVSVLYGYKRSATYKDIAAPAKFHPTNVSQALSASRDLGLTTLAGKKGLYMLTKEGEDYARLITANKVTEAKQFLGEMIQRSPLWAEIISFLRATKGETRDPFDLVLDVERKMGKKWSQGMRRALRDSYVSILSYAGLVTQEGEKIVSLVEGGRPSVEGKVGLLPSAPPAMEPLTPVRLLPRVATADTAKLQSDEFYFEVRKDLDAIDFAKQQFDAWIQRVRKVTANTEKRVTEADQ